MAGLLISGPAGGGKSQEVRKILEAHASGEGIIVVDFQSIYAAISGDRRDPETGRFPHRNPALLPLAEYLRRAAITQAVRNEQPVIVTNADGNPERRAALLAHIITGDPTPINPSVLDEVIIDEANFTVTFAAGEVVVDPGERTVHRRLSIGGVLEPECEGAANRWYKRTGGRSGSLTKTKTLPAGALGPSAALQAQNAAKFAAMVAEIERKRGLK